ncbi:flavin monoamine oxidase family protein [Leptospira sp. GIMC2001]|uniref:flavin monoamine oxidase family protein n=1 Tax=Leptospira sp. GIMC2001 TaxID=1513297 RepID=UPI00234AAA58|nr:NAD(P)/FAD-dependent oxidoreductase [Leptospira sp. GIMC2001]WCL50241.1 NAD(P)/FAD-dependent oxidoreductase [Leptospira sp. GIMC2001]
MKLNRKTFLQKLGLLSIPLIAGFPRKTSAEKVPADPNLSSRILTNTVIILGGGLSGLYAGYLLKKKGVRVRIVEASPRLGGRVMTYNDPIRGITGDIGGEWVGDSQSTIHSLAKELQLKIVRPSWNQIISLWDENRLSEKSRSSLNKLVAFQSKSPDNVAEGLDKVSLYRYLKYQGFSDGELDDLDKVVKAFYGESSKNISSQFLLSSIESKKSLFQNLGRFENGAESLVTKLKEFFTPEEILLSEKAIKVSQSSAGVQVELASGLVVRSKKVICTLPTSAIADIQWEPGLPREKIFSLLRIGYGRIRKDIISAVSPPLSPQEGNGIVDWVIPSGKSFITTLSTEGRASSLDRSTPEIGRDLLLRSISGYQPSIVETINITRVGFGSNAVSLFSPSTFGIRSELATPHNQIYFAGEHLGEVPGTMEAALSSASKAVSSM